MSHSNWVGRIVDKGGRRLGLDRRRAAAPARIPERRAGQERRSGRDRRTLEGQGNVGYLRRGMDRYLEFVNTHKGLAYGILLGLAIWGVIIFIILAKLYF